MLQFTGERFIPSKELINDEIGFEHLHRYHSIIPFIKQKTVLDIACGEGYGTDLIRKYAHKAYGVDLDESCIKWASEHYGQANNNLEFKAGTVDNIPLANNSIDVVISFETIEHVTAEVQQLFMAEVKRVLKPNGMLVISTPNTANYTNRYEHHNEFHLKEFEKEDFHSFLNSHFKHTYHFEQGYEIVSTISGEDIGTIKKLPVYTWERDLKKVNRKYLISIASNEEVPENNSLSSIVMQVDKDYLGLIDYIVSLQKHNTSQQQAITQLESTQQQLRENLQQSQESLKQSNESMQQLQQKEQQLQETIQEKEQKNKQLAIALVDKENILLDQNTKITTLQQQVDQLNGRLSEIYSSDGWKLLSVYYRLKGKVLPEGSGRHKMLKKMINTLRNKKTDHFVSTEFISQFKYIPEDIVNFDVIEFPQYDQPKVSIIIPAYNGWQMNYKCLRSIFRHTQGVSYEVIFADDGSSDETVNIKEYVKNIIAIRNEKNLGFLKNCNHAAGLAKGEYILFLNNDTEVTPGWLYSLSDLMDRDRQIGIVGSKLIYPDGRLQEAGGIMWQDASAWNYGHKQSPDASEFNYVKEVDYISGASILIRKSAWQTLGGFDEMYTPAYCEDADLAFEMRKLGLKVVYQPLSQVIHHEGFSHGTEKNPNAGLTQIKAYQKVNLTKFGEKWNDVLKTHAPNAADVFWSRDRSKAKKCILVIDHYVPQYDKDAGSRTTFQYLQLFTQMGMNVKFIGDNFHKHEPYTTALQQLGIEVLYGGYYAQNWQKWIVDNEKYFDYILLNRPHTTTKYIDFLRANTKTKIYYYGHDLHFHRELMEFEITKEKAKLASSKTWKKIEYEIFNKSDVILTPTQKEKELIQTDFEDKKVQVMPAFFYPVIANPVINFNDRKDLLFVGGFTHTPNVDAVLWFIENVFPIVRAQIGGIKLKVVGSNVPEIVQQKAAPDVIIKGFVSDQELQQLYETVKMVVIPLRFGAGLKGKTVEAMVNGLPLVSTSFGLEGVSDIENWLTPHDNEQDFAAEIASLYNDEQALRVMSANMVEYSKKHFTSESAAVFFKQLFSL